MNSKFLLVGVVVAVALGCSSKPAEKDKDVLNSPPTVDGATSEEGCHTPLGFIPEGSSATGYMQAVAQGGQTCQQGELMCRDGNWYGPYIYPSCFVTP